jgi:uncharacterized protein YkwD
LPVWLSTPEKPAQNQNLQANTICLIAKNPLRTSTAYTVSVSATVGGERWERTWSFTTAQTEQLPRRGPKTVLERVNEFRRIAGLTPVVMDDDLTAGCEAHVKYLVRNARHPSVEGLGAHQEDPKLPGYSEAGTRAGKMSDISFGTDPLISVDAWMATFFHRTPVLDPDLTRIGFAASPEREWRWVCVLDVQSGRGSNHPVFWPPDKRKDVPLAYQTGEVPDPIPQSQTKRAGYPVTVRFPLSAGVKDAVLALKAGDEEVPGWVSSPEKPAAADLQRNTVSFIAEQPLRPATTYTATIKARVDGRDWSQTWSFTTRR